jgi:hypothetical protein
VSLAEASYEEKGVWAFLAASLAAYGAYLVIVLGRAATPLSETAYQWPLVATLLATVAAAVVIRVVIEIVRPSDSDRVDARDREIYTYGVLRTWGVLIAAALAALALAMTEAAHFWIANLLYLGFVTQAVAGSIVRLLAYRRGM